METLEELELKKEQIEEEISALKRINCDKILKENMAKLAPIHDVLDKALHTTGWVKLIEDNGVRYYKLASVSPVEEDCEHDYETVVHFSYTMDADFYEYDGIIPEVCFSLRKYERPDERAIFTYYSNDEDAKFEVVENVCEIVDLIEKQKSPILQDIQ